MQYNPTQAHVLMKRIKERHGMEAEKERETNHKLSEVNK